MSAPRPVARKGSRHAGRTRLPGRLGAVAALTLGLAGCAPGLSGPATDACTHHALWTYEGGDPDERERRIDGVAELLTAEDPAGLRTASTAMSAALESGDETAFTTASTAFADACRDNGWEPPEG